MRRLFWALLAIVYLLVYPHQQALNNPNENTRVYLTMALVDEGSFSLDYPVRLFGWTNDMARVPHTPTSEDPARFHYASVKGPLTSYLGVPVYAAERQIVKILGYKLPTTNSPPAARASFLRATTLTLQLFVGHLPCLLFLCFFERFLRGVTGDRRLRFAAVLALGLGTNYLAYAFLFASHALIGAAAFGAFALVVGHQRASLGRTATTMSTSRALAIGVLVGAVTLFEYQALFVSAVLFAFAVHHLVRTAPSAGERARLVSASMLGVLPSVIGLLVFQAKSFGHALTPGHRMMDSAAFQAANSKGFFTIGAPSWASLSGLLTDGGAGLFGASPVLLLAGLSLPLVFGRGMSARFVAPARVAWAVFFALVIPVSASAIWRGGWTIGPRYLGALPPFLLFLAVLGVDDTIVRLRHRGLGGLARPTVVSVFAALGLVSFVSLGVVAFVTTTLPEVVQRPLVQVAWPFLRSGLVPHHALELLGVAGRWPVYLAVLLAASLVVGVLCAALSRSGKNRRAWWWAGLATALTLGLGALLLACVPGSAEGDVEVRAEVRAIFARGWEPRR